MKYIFAYRNIILGGCELLICKLAKELNAKGASALIVYEKISDTMLEYLEKNGLQHQQVSQWKKDNLRSFLQNPDEEYRVITFLWWDFIACYFAERNVKTILYVVHKLALALGQGQKKVLQEAIKIPVSMRLKRLAKSGHILFMDEETLNYTQHYYHSPKLAASILRIPVDPIEYGIKIETSAEVNILSIARSEFPFKGYLIGLVKWFASCDDNYTLTIISHGKDIEMLRAEIATLPIRKQLRVDLIGETPYEELEQYFAKASVYVGMGTTILDASMRGIVSIPVVAYTYDLLVRQYFYENYTELGLQQGEENLFDKLISNVRNADSARRYEMARKSRKCVLDNYSTPVIAECLQKHFANITANYKNCILHYFESRYRNQNKL